MDRSAFMEFSFKCRESLVTYMVLDTFRIPFCGFLVDSQA